MDANTQEWVKKEIRTRKWTFQWKEAVRHVGDDSGGWAVAAGSVCSVIRSDGRHIGERHVQPDGTKADVEIELAYEIMGPHYG
jgi:hypothetical protein